MERLKIDDLKKYFFLSELKFSPNGQNSAFIAKKASDDNGYYSSIFILKEDNCCPLTNEKGNVFSFIWLDDENILFSEIRDKESKDKKERGQEISSFHKININGGEAKHAFNIDAEVLKIDLLPNGDFLVSAIFNDRPKDLSVKNDYEVIEELPFWSNGEGFIYGKIKRLYTYNAEKGLTLLTPPASDVSEYKISKNGIIAYTEAPKTSAVKDIKEYLYVIDSGKVEKILDEAMFIYTFDFWKDKIILAASKGENYSFYEHPTFYILDPKDKSRAEIFKYDRSICTSMFTDCSYGEGFSHKVYGDNFYFTSIDGIYSDIYELNLNTKELKNITNSKGSVQFFDIDQDGDFIAVGLLGGRLQEVYSLEDGRLVQKTKFNEKFNVSNTKLNYHVIKDKEGAEFDGFIMFPVDYDENKKYPAILEIHGGPKAAYGDVYFHEMKYFANEGYFVLFCNPRGSDGKGNEFANIRGKYGTIDYDNIMQFVDEMLKIYISIDREKIGVTGGSYGGYMTNWIVGHTDRFKAAVAQRGIVNWISMYVSDIGYYFAPNEMDASLWGDFEKLWWHSPLKYANKIKTPTLILHSDEDYRCPIIEGYQMFTALKINNVPSKLVVFHGENHELSRSGKPEHRIKRLEEIIEWMNKYLK
ncbi:MAG: S9 family peptidase [Oscillospiraceae bacterium]|nr:S9 family peptidase [Oscillospiraceae bacterium]